MTVQTKAAAIVLLGLLAAAACVGDGTGLDQNGNPIGSGPLPGSISFATDIQPIFTGNCALTGCHAGTSPQQGQNLSGGQAYANIVDVISNEAPPMRRVRPSKPDSSYLVHKIQGTQATVGGVGGRMPLGMGALAQADIDKIRAWITAGAPNN